MPELMTELRARCLETPHAENVLRKASAETCVTPCAAMAEGAAAAAPARPATLPPGLVGDASLRLNNTW